MRTVITAGMVGLVTVAVLAAPASAGHGVTQHETGSLFVGTPIVGIGHAAVAGVNTNDLHGHDGVSFVQIPLDTNATDGDGTVADRTFWLNATGGQDGVFGSPDFDVCWHKANGDRISCSAAVGDETGTVPTAAAQAQIFLFDGREASFSLVVA